MSNSHTKRPRSSPSNSADAGPKPSEQATIGRRERRAAETRIRLFHSALELIAERGLEKVTVEDITEAADVGKGTFFNYFATKEHVLGVMAEIQLGKLQEAMSRVAQGHEPLRVVLHKLVGRLAEEPGRSPKLARAMIGSFLGSEKVREILKRKMADGRKAIAEVVRIGQERGEIHPSLKSEKVAMQLLQMVMATVLLWSLHEKPALSRWMEDSFEHAWRAIRAPGKSQGA
jgi:AcrR family transcriptional regulator